MSRAPTYTACLHCGSFDLRIPSISGGGALFPGAEEIMGTAVCAHCGWKGVPLEFESMEAVEAFRQSRVGAPPTVPEDFSSAFPQADAVPRSRLVPALLVVAGAATMAVAGGVLLFQAAQGDGMGAIATALVGVALGLPLVMIGLRQARGMRRAAPPPDA